ncbi:PAS domain-containing protein [Vibrio sp. JC009]|uniref:PAS domain-containing protein n=1 Tax=Vibrio sp. JC009 TaxID=2912314 RepID=UPI0023AE9456|nr:PAS domain-containing protein [Vibrio sp. JC009]WED23664.1 PAS domain-containing protein [Vibrio sp. JC009]
MSDKSEKEVPVRRDDLIVSKTDLKGDITYANRTFMRIANYSEQELLGEPHSIIRHPDIPRGVFYGMWKAIKSGKEFFGLVKNYTSDKNYYWVFANITPDYENGKMIGFFSVRRHAPKAARKIIEPVYQQMLEMEKGLPANTAPKTSWSWVEELIRENYQQEYEEFILKLYQKHCDED